MKSNANVSDKSGWDAKNWLRLGDKTGLIGKTGLFSGDDEEGF